MRRRRSARWSPTRSNTLGADVVRAYADADNTASIRVAEKVGMRLIERFEHREGNEVWFGVRYERRAHGRAGGVSLSERRSRGAPVARRR